MDQALEKLQDDMCNKSLFYILNACNLNGRSNLIHPVAKDNAYRVLSDDISFS